ncbi:family 20 glycosylhydrolase [Tamlana sp. 2201CG12-4]|uniref:family 20 glycosylhydrolase n=1 Tax=Tamlana sp. 2201CG12-4 TaxID=3112582 RepID=UPI002DB64DF2|nr:family 20 glycosylhydrolase [Tamlana sp. 2201CG12-4]MEC3908482.1 family 20 glycosylhydrolase [Tamlana sp. 2201CG12-4]
MTKSVYRIIVVFLVATALYSCQTKEKTNAREAYHIIPQPQKLTPKDGTFQFTANTQIILSEDSEELRFLGNYLSDMFSRAAGFSLNPTQGTEAGKGNIYLSLDTAIEGNDEAYQLIVSSENITITANHASGLLYGIQSIRQLLPDAIEAKEVQSNVSWEIPSVEIEDEPRFEYRGMQMDVSRHFFDVDELKTFIDRLALFKFNRFHIHLTDDQGWRLQINRYPELTDNGAWRTMNSHDKVCIERAETDPAFELPKKHFKEKEGIEVYGGFYTQEQMKAVIAYASKRGITIVPEIDMPGHMKAAIDSYPDLSCVEGAGWGQTFSIPLCPCEEGVYEFVENVLEEVVELFPGEYIHIGADEVEKSTWADALQCKELMKREGLESVEELQSYFVKRVEKYLNSKGKKMIGWDEALEGGINPSTTIMYWRGWVPQAPVEAAEGGHNVIMTPTSHSYFDYEPNNESVSHVYNFDPIPEALRGKHEENIKGVQANLWSEYIPTMARLDYMSMPRMMSMAEVGWSNKEKDEANFLSRVDNIYSRLDAMEIKYRLPDIPSLPSYDAFVESDTLELEKPGIIDEIRYTTDGSIPGIRSALYESPIVVTQPTVFKIATFRKGRRVKVYKAEYEQQTYRKAEEVNTQPGLKMNYYEGEFSKVADMDGEKVAKSSIVTVVDIPDWSKENGFGLQFKGYLDAPEIGVYSFYLRSDDGSTLKVGDKTVVDNDGGHGVIEVRGQIALEKGKHPIHIKYFEGSGGESLSFQYHLKGKEKEKKPVPVSMLGHK